MLERALQYATENPTHHVWVVCATVSHAGMLKVAWRSMDGPTNVDFINLHQARNAYSHADYKVFWDHYAAEEQMTKDIHAAYEAFYERIKDSK